LRDNIHSADVSLGVFAAFPRSAARRRRLQPRRRTLSGNLLDAGGRSTSASRSRANHTRLGRCWTSRGIGDHRWWISDLGEFRRDYPNWEPPLRPRDGRCVRSTSAMSNAGRPVRWTRPDSLARIRIRRDEDDGPVSRRLNVLVLGVGGNVSQGIQKALRALRRRRRARSRVASTRRAPGLYVADPPPLISPLAADPRFVPWLLDICRGEAIDAVLSGNEDVLARDRSAGAGNPRRDRSGLRRPARQDVPRNRPRTSC